MSLNFVTFRLKPKLWKTLFWTKLETLHKSQDKKIRKKRVAKSKAMLQCYTTPMHNTASMMKMQVHVVCWSVGLGRYVGSYFPFISIFVMKRSRSCT